MNLQLVLVCGITTIILVGIPGDCRIVRQSRGSPIRLGREWINARRIEDQTGLEQEVQLYKRGTGFVSRQAYASRDLVPDWSGSGYNAFSRDENEDTEDNVTDESNRDKKGIVDFHYNAEEQYPDPYYIN